MVLSLKQSPWIRRHLRFSLSSHYWCISVTRHRSIPSPSLWCPIWPCTHSGRSAGGRRMSRSSTRGWVNAEILICFQKSTDLSVNILEVRFKGSKNGISYVFLLFLGYMHPCIQEYETYCNNILIKALALWLETINFCVWICDGEKMEFSGSCCAGQMCKADTNIWSGNNRWWKFQLQTAGNPKRQCRICNIYMTYDSKHFWYFHIV